MSTDHDSTEKDAGPVDMRRRALLAGLVGAGVLSCSRPGDKPIAAEPVAPIADPWARVRAEFNLSREWIHMGGFLLASHPKPVREAIEQHRRGLDDNPVHYLDAHEDFGGGVDAETRVRQAAAAYMGAKHEEIALTDSTTMGLGTLYHALPLRQGDEVVTTLHDHYATHEALRLTAERSGATVKKVALYKQPAAASTPEIAAAISGAITKATRVVAITWVHSSTGVKVPVRAVADVVAKANLGRSEKERILLAVDGVHGFGVDDASMSDLGCDFFVAGCHKWMFGPRGTGVVWGRQDLWALLHPTVPHFGREAFAAWLKGEPPPPTNASMMTPGGFHSFEHRWALAEAFEFHRAIGKAKVAARIHELNRQCKEGLAQMKHVTLHTPRADELSAGIVCFDVAGLEPKAVVARLKEKKIIATTTPYATVYARLAPSLLNAPEDVEATLRQIRALA